jgi:MFS family permease
MPHSLLVHPHIGSALLNATVLGAAILGALVFGGVADLVGRKRVYWRVAAGDDGEVRPRCQLGCLLLLPH